MNGSDGRPAPAPLSNAGWIEAAVAACLLATRIALRPGALWKDWVAIVCAWWLVAVFAPGGRTWKAATVLVMLWLLGVYLVGQIPLIVDTLRFQL